MPDPKSILTVEQFTRAYMDLAENSPQYTPAQLDEFWVKMGNVFLNTDEKSLAAQQELEQKRKTLPESVNAVFDIFKSAAVNQEQTSEVVNIVRLVLGCYMERGGDETNLTRLNIFINRIKLFKDKALVYKATQRIKHFWKFTHPQMPIRPNTSNAMYRNIAYILANSEYATTEDIADLIYFCPTFDEAHKILNAVCASADKQLNFEMSKEVPDIAEIKNITHYVKDCLRVIQESIQFKDPHNNNPELRSLYYWDMPPAEKDVISEDFRKLKEIIYKKYDANSIFASDNPEFTKQFDRGVIEQMILVQQENATLRQANENLSKANAEATAKTRKIIADKEAAIVKAESQIETLRARITQLELAINDANGKNENAKSTIKLLRGQIKTLINAAQQVRGGLGARGMTELHNAIDKITTREI